MRFTLLNKFPPKKQKHYFALRVFIKASSFWFSFIVDFVTTPTTQSLTDLPTISSFAEIRINYIILRIPCYLIIYFACRILFLWFSCVSWIYLSVLATTQRHRKRNYRFVIFGRGDYFTLRARRFFIRRFVVIVIVFWLIWKLSRGNYKMINAKRNCFW